MKKVKEALFSALNFLVIAALIAVITLGLNRIGIFEFPDFIGEILNGRKNVQTVLPGDDGKIYESLSNGINTDTVNVVSELNQENVRRLLENVSVQPSYYQELEVSLYDENGKSITRKAVVRRTDGFTDVTLYDVNNRLIKLIEQQIDGVKITVPEGNSERSAFFSEGSISIEQESGVVMTHKLFLDSEFVGKEPSYSVAYSSYGTVMQIVFETHDAKLPQTQKYWLSLDYGIVVRAETYENDSLVYLLETSVLGKDLG